MQHIADKYPDGRVTGTFAAVPGSDVFGDLRLRGAQTSLELRHDTYFSTHDMPDHCITGILHDLTRVTLLGCFVTSHGTAGRHNEGYHQASISPQFVALGDAHVRPNEAIVRSLAFTIDDAGLLFHDRNAFGSLLDARPYIEQIIKANRPKREIAIGEYPRIHYYTGKDEIVRAETCLGVVTVSNNPSWGLSSSAGVRMDNQIIIKLELGSPATFYDAMTRVYPMQRFFELMIGRPQNIQELWLQLPDLQEERPNYLDIYWTHPPSRDVRHELSPPHPCDVLVSPVDETASFAAVMSNWLEQDKSRQIARVRFTEACAWQRYYPRDRIVGAANMFDILPDDAAPAMAEIAPDVRAAKETSRELFLALPQSLERDAMLQALGRIGKSSLKHKARHRAKSIVAALGKQALPDLCMVIDEAVNCRNYFVHGGRSSFDYNEQLGGVVFLTNTLEFVFGASDLIDAGWDIASWRKRAFTASHPFSSYLCNYEVSLRDLRELLSKG